MKKSNNILEYKGYHTKVEYDANANILTGVILGINDFVNFEADNLQDVEKEFHSAVDDYVFYCKQMGKEPEKEYKGTFNIRIDPELHKWLSETSEKTGKSLNNLVEIAIKQFANNSSNTAENVAVKKL